MRGRASREKHARNAFRVPTPPGPFGWGSKDGHEQEIQEKSSENGRNETKSNEMKETVDEGLRLVDVATFDRRIRRTHQTNGADDGKTKPFLARCN